MGRDLVYLDNAATSLPKPESVVEAVKDALTRAGNPGRSGHFLSYQSMRDLFEAREAVARLVGADDSSRIVLTPNATFALNLAIKGVLKEGDHVVTSVMEHNSVLRPLSSLSERGVEVTYVEADHEGYVDPDDVIRAFRKNTKMVVLTHGSNVTGAVNDVASVGKATRERGILFLVDASQTAGVRHINVEEMGVDLLAAPGHKALFGPQGTGFLYVREGIRVEPLVEGGTGSRSEEPRHPEFYPDRLEAGTLNSVGFAGLVEGIAFVEGKGIENIYAHERELTSRLLESLRGERRIVVYGPGGTRDRLGVVLVNVKGADPGEVAMVLDEKHGIMVRAGLHCAPFAHRVLGTFPEGGVRISFSAMNTKEDADMAVRALLEIAREMGSDS
ncbi:MAG: aminotransferase class V-fold PLP-dependent enzyme [Deltaproteobacteria bacterium]|nr:MAG: aminotransferase class V-fold PLP-dependent enzyme [Deltaproteobacteria bacterium]